MHATEKTTRKTALGKGWICSLLHVRCFQAHPEKHRAWSILLLLFKGKRQGTACFSACGLCSEGKVYADYMLGRRGLWP